jgi:hypothetical protein
MITQTALQLLSHTFSREDLFCTLFVLIDDWMKQNYQSDNLPRKTLKPEFTDAEVVTILLVGELCQSPRERSWIRQVQSSYRHLFPLLPEGSRFSRRAERVIPVVIAFRKQVLHWADVDLTPTRIIDSFPLPLCANYRVFQSSIPITGETFGYCASKKEYYFGLHPLALMTETGFVDELFLAPGNMSDSDLLNHFLSECERERKPISGQVWVGDKGFVSKSRQCWAKAILGVDLQMRMRDYGKKCSEYLRKKDSFAPFQEGVVPFFQRLLDYIRHPIEGFLSVLTHSYHLADMLVKTDIGIYRRVEAKITAFNVARYFNLVLGKPLTDVSRYAV